MDPTLSPGFRQTTDAAVIVACDGAYLPYAGVLAAQLAAVEGRGFDVLIGSPEPLALPPALAAAGIGHVAAQDAGLAQSLPLDARRSLATYMEIFLARALAGRWRRILVLDADILLERGDPTPLLAAEDVPEAGFTGRMKGAVMRLGHKAVEAAGL